MLTEKQKELLLFIHARLQETGVPPSFDEMKDALDLQVEIGHPPPDHGARGARLHPPPAAPRARHRGHQAARGHADAGAAQRRAGFQPKRHRGQRRRSRAALPRPRPAMRHAAPVTVPVMGRIAAGVPISAIQNHTHDIAVPARPADQRRAFRARGEGRFDDRGRHPRRRHRHHARCDTAENGDIVVALVEKEEATLKRLRKKGASIALEAANPELRDAHLRARPGRHPGPARRSDPQVLTDRRSARLDRGCCLSSEARLLRYSSSPAQEYLHAWE